MKIPCKDIALSLKKILQKNNAPKLVTILVGSSPEQLSFVNIKRRIAREIGVEFELVHLRDTPPLSTFLEIVTQKARDPKTSGIIVQHPFPDSYSIEKIYTCIPPRKEIEGFHPESRFHFPLSLAVLSAIKWIINPDDSIISFQEDATILHAFLKDKNIVIAGRGVTGGAPIARALSKIGVQFSITNSTTENTKNMYKSADIIITATGKSILDSSMIKQGVILLNVGLRKEGGKLRGDYDESEIDERAAYYTETPGGLGPLDVLYLFKNVIEAEEGKRGDRS